MRARSLGVLTAAALLTLGLSAPAASADPTVWRWGKIQSTDGWATAWGKVSVGQSGFVVTGNLDDSYGKTCSWLLLKYMSSQNGRWRTHGIYNCQTGSGTFRKSVGGVLQIKAMACRGTSKRPLNKCSRWKTIYTQGG